MSLKAKTSNWVKSTLCEYNGLVFHCRHFLENVTVCLFNGDTTESAHFSVFRESVDSNNTVHMQLKFMDLTEIYRSTNSIFIQKNYKNSLTL